MIFSQTLTNHREKIYQLDPEVIYSKAQSEKKVAYHELILGYSNVRLYFDYDSKTIPFPRNKFDNALN